jgi:hypothetical protein
LTRRLFAKLAYSVSSEKTPLTKETCVTDSYSSRPSQPRPHRSRGHHLGCAGLALATAILVCAAFVYGGWFFAQGYRNDPGLKNALAVVRANPVAQSILGDGIAIEDMQSETFSATTGHGKTVSYTVRLKGKRAEGLLHVMLHSVGSDTKIVSIVLTGPDEERYNLTAPEVAAPAGSI